MVFLFEKSRFLNIITRWFCVFLPQNDNTQDLKWWSFFFYNLLGALLWISDAIRTDVPVSWNSARAGPQVWPSCRCRGFEFYLIFNFSLGEKHSDWAGFTHSSEPNVHCVSRSSCHGLITLLESSGNSRANEDKRALTSGNSCIYQTQKPIRVYPRLCLSWWL